MGDNSQYYLIRFVNVVLINGVNSSMNGDFSDWVRNTLVWIRDNTKTKWHRKTEKKKHMQSNINKTKVRVATLDKKVEFRPQI